MRLAHSWFTIITYRWRYLMSSRHCKGHFAPSRRTSKASPRSLPAGGIHQSPTRARGLLPALPIAGNLASLAARIPPPSHPGSTVLRNPPVLHSCLHPLTPLSGLTRGHPPRPPQYRGLPCAPTLAAICCLPGYRRPESAEQVLELGQCLLTDESANPGDQRKGPGGRTEAG